MAAIRGIGAGLATPEGKALALYSPDRKITDQPGPGNTLQKYVEAVPRAEFIVQLAVKPKYDFGAVKAIGFDILVDGKMYGRMVLTKEAYGSGEKPWVSRISKDTPRDQAGARRNAKLEFSGLTFLTQANKYWYAESPNTQLCTVAVDVRKGYIDDRDRFTKDPNSEALAYFTFIYRTREQLDGMDLDPFVPQVTWARQNGRSRANTGAEREWQDERRSRQSAQGSRDGEAPEETDVERPENVPIPSVETDETDAPGSPIEHDDIGDEDWELLSSDGRNEEPGRGPGMDTRRLVPNDDDDVGDKDFDLPGGYSLVRQHHDSIELGCGLTPYDGTGLNPNYGRGLTPGDGRGLTPSPQPTHREPSMPIKPEPGNKRHTPFGADPMAEQATRRAELLEIWDRMHRELSPMEDGDHEVVKAKFEKRARIRQGRKKTQAYFAREDRVSKAAPARRRSTINADRFPGRNLINLTEDSD